MGLMSLDFVNGKYKWMDGSYKNPNYKKKDDQ